MTNFTHRRALALVGMPGAGKTLCAKHLEARGFFQFRFGGIIVDEVVRRGWQVKPENERIVREELRQNGGMDAIAHLALPRLQEALEASPNIIIDGLYSWSEYKTLQEKLGAQIIVVAVFAPRHMRYARLTERPIRPLTIEEASQRDWQEIENLEKGGPIAIADYTLINDTHPQDLLNRLDTLLADLAFSPQQS
jgi:dephospho-CoA kinase